MRKVISVLTLFTFLFFSTHALSQCNNLGTAINDGFENGINNWTIIDNNADGNSWSLINQSFTANSGDYYLRSSYSSSGPCDDIAFSECLEMASGQTYNVSFYTKAYNSGYPERLRIIISTDTTSASIVDTIAEIDPLSSSSYALKSFDFSLSNSGDYFIGFQAYSQSNQWFIYLDDISIKKIIPAEAKAVSISSSAASSCDIGSSESVSISLMNNGTDPISSLDVSLLLNGGNIATETISPSSPINPGDTIAHTFSSTIDLSQDGQYEISAILQLSNDHDPSNDTLKLDIDNYTTANLSSSAVAMGFEAAEKDEFNKWLVLDNNNDGHQWIKSSYSYSGDSSISCQTDSTAADDWLISSCIDLVSGEQYVVSLAAQKDSNNNNSDLVVKIGADRTAASMTDIVLNQTNITPTWSLLTDTFTASSSGVFYFGFQATQAASMGAIYLDDISISKLNAVSINESSLNGIEVYPNPSNGQFIIKFKNIAPASITDIYNSRGQQVYSQKSPKALEVNAQGWSPGIYHIKVSNTKKTYSHRIVIK